MKKKTYSKEGNTKSTKNKVVKKISKVARKTKNEVGIEVKKLKQKYKKSPLSQKILILFMLGITALLILFLIFGLFIIISAPNFKSENLYSKNSTVVYDINGNEAARLGTENREIVTYEELPESLIDAIIATEDSRYFQHDGIDLARFTKAVFGQLLGHSDAGGGSTLTMQVAKKAFTSSVDTGIKGIIRKFTDIYLAVFKIETNYTKEQIIEFYVNIPYLGSGTYGVQQASKTYFNKDVSELSLSEAAMIAGLFQAPGAYDPYLYPEKAEARRNIVLNLMCKHRYITEEQRDIAKSIPVKTLLAETNKSLNKYIGFIDTVVEEVEDRTGQDPYVVSMNIYSTLNPEKQDVIEKINSGESFKWANDVAQTGIAVIDVETGGIAAVGAGRNKTSARSWNFATMERNHPGSTAKPIFDYGPAVEYLNWGSGQTVVDDTYSYSGGGKIKNWDNKFKGVMTAREALAASRNIPALYTFQQVKQSDIKEFVTNLGITPEYEGNAIVESHSIGGFNGTTPLELAAAYATFARGGTYIEPHSFTKIEFVDTNEIFEVKPKKHEAMSESTAYIINKMLQRTITGGYVSASVPSGTDVASKTGTSTVDSAAVKALGIKKSVIGDVWQVAYSPDYTIAMWYGYKELTKDNFLTSGEGTPARRNIIKALTKGILEKNSRWSQPKSVVTAEIELGTDPLQLASEFTPEDLRSTEYFKKGTAPTETSTRFATLENPTNIKYSAGINSVTITWDPIKTPDAINQEYLTKYFNNSVYSNWADKYLTERLDYNNANIGTLGYAVYLQTASGLQYLTHTTSNSYTYNGFIDTSLTFVIKSQYTIFTSNQSSGAEITILANTDNTTTTTENSNNWTPTLNTANCIDIKNYRYNDSSQVNITEDGNVIDFSKYSVIDECIETTTNSKTSCSSLNETLTYKVTRTIKYKQTSKTLTLNISSTCN